MKKTSISSLRVALALSLSSTVLAGNIHGVRAAGDIHG